MSALQVMLPSRMPKALAALAGGLALHVASCGPAVPTQGRGESRPIAASDVATAGGDAPSSFDHSGWDRILEENVTSEGWVDYRAIQKRWAGELDRYLRALGDARPEDMATDGERAAFWINAYNAVCVRTLIDRGLPREVPHAALLGANIFREKNHRVAGKVRSLDEIEHEILRREFDDERIHAALVCGASSCPRLRREAYTGAKLDEQLDEECRFWIREGRTKKGERKNRLDRAAGVLYLSKIFDWYSEDFGGAAGVLEFVERHSDPEDRAHLEANEVRIRYHDYDWALNSRDGS